MKVIVNIFFLLLTIGFLSQEKQPKVGLVLSGGGAKGFAHIGVLKEIDKAGIQLDYIGGTSMGAMIGGLYAAGYSAVQLEKIILETDFNSILRDELPRSSGTFFEKEHGEKTIVTLPVSKEGIGLPKAVSKGQNVLSMLLELAESLDNNIEFSKLPTPFFCIATNVETGTEVLLEKGSLPLALRASGSFPTLLNPVLLENQLLVDGGVANNFPVSIMKSKGMDIIIGVDVEGKLSTGDKLNSAIDIMNQVVSYQMYNKSSTEKRKLDVHIKPNIFDYSVVDFDKKDEILEKGAIEAKKFTKIFLQIAAKQTKKGNREKINITDKKLLVSSIRVSGVKNYTTAFILGKLNIKNGDSLSRKDITKRIYLLSATRNFSIIEYKFIKKIDESYLLDFKLKESNEGANLKIGLHYDFLYKSGVLANYNKKNVLNKNDLLSLDVVLGDNLRYNLNYFVDNGFYTSYGFRSRYNHFRTNTKFNSALTEFPSNINLKYTDITNQIFVQTTFDRKFSLGLGLEHKNISASTGTLKTDNEDFIIDKSNYFNTFGYLKVDTYDKKYFVTKGYFADLNFKWYLYSTGSNENFRSFGQTKGTLGFAKTFGNRLTFQNTYGAGFTLDNPSSDIFDFYLGGNNQNYINTFVSFYGYEFAELSNNSFLKTEFDFRYRFGEKHYVSFIANYGRLDSNVFRDIDIFKDIKSGYAVGYSYDSIVGPLEIKYSWSPDTKERQWLFNLGFWF